MIRLHSNRTGPGIALPLFFTALFALTACVQKDPYATAKKEAGDAMQTWLAEMDAGDYAQSWSDASSSFQKAVTSDKWVSMAQAVRTPLGKLISRKQVSALYDEAIQGPGGSMVPGPYVIAQFKTSFDNLPSAEETVTFDKIDGTWRAAGYYIKPGN